jgi:hypothetical protein
MPEVCRIGKGSIKVCIHTNEHGEPHVHVQYDSEWAKVAINDGHIIKGKLPGHQRRLVEKWIETRRPDLLAAWSRAEQGETVGNIAE